MDKSTASKIESQKKRKQLEWEFRKRDGKTERMVNDKRFDKDRNRKKSSTNRNEKILWKKCVNDLSISMNVRNVGGVCQPKM